MHVAKATMYACACSMIALWGSRSLATTYQPGQGPGDERLARGAAGTRAQFATPACGIHLHPVPNKTFHQGRS